MQVFVPYSEATARWLAREPAGHKPGDDGAVPAPAVRLVPYQLSYACFRWSLCDEHDRAVETPTAS